MKTAISIPDEVFKTADLFARRRKVSRSALITQAVEEFLAHHRREGVTEQLNRVYEHEDSALDPLMGTMQAAAVPKEKW